MKRLMDLLITMMVAPFALPLGAGIAVAVLLGRNGPVFYRSLRFGQHGELFQMLKFRTMYAEDQQALGPGETETLAFHFKLDDDPRVTPFGRRLRRFSLDELPQLVNVLRGEMSLVGPRPKLPEEGHLFGDSLDELLSVRPGITGEWQVRRDTANSDSNMRALDLGYVRHHSLGRDLRLLVLTVGVLASRRNY